jgi:hypothetical protein
MAVLAPGDGEQRFEQPFLPLAGSDDALAISLRTAVSAFASAQSDLGGRELEGDLAARLVSGVGDKAPFRFGPGPPRT